MNTSWKNKVALVTGGTSGIGEGAALALARAGAKVVVAGRRDVKLLKDGWTVVTEDGQRAAHFEHTVAVTKNGPWILTRPKEAAGPVW